MTFNSKGQLQKLKVTGSDTMNIFRFFLFSFEIILEIELSYVLTIKKFSTAKNCTEKRIIL